MNRKSLPSLYPTLDQGSGMIASRKPLPTTHIKIGAQAVDLRLGGGLMRSALHEFFSGPLADNCAAASFALLLAAPQCIQRPLIWVREDRNEQYCERLYPLGMIDLGADPKTTVLVSAPDALSLLRAGADAIKCGAVSTVILELRGKAPALDLTASRRLALAAARSGVLTLMVRSGVEPMPSAAQTRWRVNSAPSRALAGNAPGLPTFDLSLLRHRSGIAGFNARVEWDRDQRFFKDTPLSGGVSTLFVGAAGDADERLAA